MQYNPYMKLEPSQSGVVIAGLGRCGTTMLCNAFNLDVRFHARLDLLARRFPKRYLQSIIKTHDFPPRTPEVWAGYRFIFLFGNVPDLVWSYMNQKDVEWVEYTHLHMDSCESGPLDMLCQWDVFRLEEHFDKWCRPCGLKHMMVRYETMWDHVEEIKEFAEQGLGLPQRAARKHVAKRDMKTDEYTQVLEAYDPLIKKIDLCPDIWCPE